MIKCIILIGNHIFKSFIINGLEISIDKNMRKWHGRIDSLTIRLQ